MYKQITIKTLHKQGSANSTIARQLDCHRNTVRNVLLRKEAIEIQTRIKGWIFDPYQEQIKEWRKKDITILRMYEMLTKDYGITTTYINLCKYIQKEFPKTPEAFGVQQHLPGETAEIDFGYLGMFPGVAGKNVKTYGLVAVLPFSRIAYYAICYDQKLETLRKELVNAFAYFGGAPKNIKVDNMKTAILKNQHYDLEFNQDFLEFCHHYGTVILPCEPYSPEQKGTVESGVKYMQKNFIAGRTFTDDYDIRKQLADWITYANKRVHGTTKKIPMEVFLAEEKSILQPLPQEEFAFFTRGIRKVSNNCHIHFENNYYSVPALLVGKDVLIRWNEHILRILYQGEQVALHSKSHGQGNYVTKRHHLPDYKIYSQTEYQAREEEKMADIGDGAHQYFQMLLTDKVSYWTRIVRGILGFVQTYGKDAVNKSLKRALYYRVVNLTTIKNILEKKLYMLEIEPIQFFKNRDGQMSRDLSYYESATHS
jgi:transposase